MVGGSSAGSVLPSTEGATSSRQRHPTGASQSSRTNGNGNGNHRNGASSNGGGAHVSTLNAQVTVPQMDGNETFSDFSDEDDQASVVLRTYVSKISLTVAQKDPCPPSLCNGAHHLIIDCPKFLAMTPKERDEVIVKEKRCPACFRKDHPSGKCKAKLCKKCGRKHHHLLCGARPAFKKDQKEYRKMCKQTGVVVEDIHPLHERKAFLQTNYSDKFDSGNESGDDASDSDSSSDECAGAAEPSSGLATDGTPVQGPTTSLMSRVSRQHHSHLEVQQEEVTRDLMKVNEDAFSTFVSQPARQ